MTQDTENFLEAHQSSRDSELAALRKLVVDLRVEVIRQKMRAQQWEEYVARLRNGHEKP